ncbi:hypothetical protein [Rhodococcus sp. NPDC127528]|uniref:hypothetical protein n=1 Tax=unclassified Rhodococcus (in: high G+C Gram-positive bacteria) TaxID=192944 RepID=UPI00362EE06F
MSSRTGDPDADTVELAASTRRGGDLGAAAAGVSAVLLAAGATGFASFRSARATRTRLNLARAEFLGPAS